MIIKNRSRVEILCDIISAAKLGCKKTHLMYQANLSFHQLESYLDLILKNGLVAKRYVEEETLYFATEKGLRFLSAAEKINDLLLVSRSNSKKDEIGMLSSFTSVATVSKTPATLGSADESAF